MAQHRAYVQEKLGGAVSIQLVDTPTPTSGQVLVRVLATPLLSYAKEVLNGNLFPLVHPFTPGLAAIGRVVTCGPEISFLAPGQLVFCNPLIAARDDDTAGSVILQGWFGGVDASSRKLMEETWRNGSWAERMLAPAENVVPLDEHRLVQELGYSIPELVWMNELLVPFGGWYAAGLKAGETAIVAPASGHFGGGAVKVALAIGARRVIAAARNEAALTLLEQLDQHGRVKGVKLTGDVEADAEALRAATPAGKGADVYLDFSPPQATTANHPQACIRALKHGGQAILMGGVQRSLELDYGHLMLGNITVRGNFMYPLEVPFKAAGLLEGGVLSLKALNTATYGFEALQEGLDFAEKHSGMADLTVLTI